MASSSSRFPGTMIMLSRMVYSMNWYNLSPALDQIANDFGINFSGTGILFSLFLFGVGAFQVPAGVLASKVGTKRVAMGGLAIMGISVLASSFSPSYSFLIIMRLVTGISAAFFFSTAIGILYELYARDITRMVGFYNSFFAIGGGIGIFLFTPVTNIFGWRINTLLAGLATIVVAAITAFSLPRSNPVGKLDYREVFERLTDRTIWFIAIGLDGLWALNFTFSEYFKPYAISLGQSQIAAGLMGGMILFVGVLGGYAAGKLRKYSLFWVVVIFTIVVGVSIMSIPWLSGPMIWIPVLTDGIMAVTVISSEYAILIWLDRDPRYVPLSLGTVNSIQIGIGSIVPFVFASLDTSSYTPSWLFLGLLSILLLPLAGVVLKRKGV